MGVLRWLPHHVSRGRIFDRVQVVRWWHMRRVLLVGVPAVDDSEDDVPPERAARVWQSDPSDEDALFVRLHDDTMQVKITMRDMAVQTSTWES